MAKEIISAVYCLDMGLFDVAEAHMRQAELFAGAAAYAAELESRVQTLERARL